LEYSVRARINLTITRGTKKSGVWKILGYSREDLTAHLERLFEPGMSWDNYGRGGWHIDHVVPVSAFNYTEPGHIDFRRCWALDNLQPMWEAQNLSKGASLSEPFQPALRLVA